MMNCNVENSSHRKRRKLSSKVWDVFTNYEGEDGKVYAKCSHCQIGFDGSSKKGTTYLKISFRKMPKIKNRKS